MTKRISRQMLKAAASAAVLAIMPAGAHAAECFDRNTDDQKAGNATAVVGPAVDVQRLDRDDLFRPASGADMFSGDTVRTGDASHLQLKLCDWSTYTFSPNSESAINEFFNAQGAGRRRVVNFVRGGFRFSSGRDTEPGSTEVEIQESGVTMGVRGTNVILAEVDGYVYALLEGPVRDNSGLTPKGLVEFWTEGNREAILAALKRPGFAVRIGPDGVSEPFRADPELLRRIYEAFVPVIPESDGSTFDYAGDPLNNSGQGAQEGDEERQYAENKHERDDENTESKPEQPSVEDGDGMQPPPPPVMIPVGDILPLDALETFASQQSFPSGHVLALAPAQLFTDNGGGASLADEGVALIQIVIDWENRTVAPEALASFIKFDFSVSDPDDLTVADIDALVPDEVVDAYRNAVVDSAFAPFDNGQNGLAVFDGAPMFIFTLRQGANDTATADVQVDFTAVDMQAVSYNALAEASFLEIMPGEGQLAFFDGVDFGDLFSLTDLETYQINGGGTTLAGFNDFLVSTNVGAPGLIDGVAYSQVELDFNNRTIGGPNSFIAFSGVLGGNLTAQLVPLNQSVSFQDGLFDLAFYPLANLTGDADLQKGQFLLADLEGLTGDIAAILSDDDGNHVYTELLSAGVGRGSLALSAIADLEAQAGNLGAGTFFYDGTPDAFVNNFADLVTANGDSGFGTAEAVIEINFANRTVGGGASYLAADVSILATGGMVNFNEALNAVSFDEGLKGTGAFAFDGSDFGGTNLNAALLLLRSGQQIGAGELADIYFDFNDGAGGEGYGAIEGMPFSVPNP